MKKLVLSLAVLSTLTRPNSFDLLFVHLAMYSTRPLPDGGERRYENDVDGTWRECSNFDLNNGLARSRDEHSWSVYRFYKQERTHKLPT